MESICVARAETSFEDLSGVFRSSKEPQSCNKHRDFSRQYCTVYAARLSQVRDQLEQAARARWGEDVAVLTVPQLDEEAGADDSQCVLIGTIFKRQQLKPSILKEISDEHNLQPQPRRQCFADDTDELMLEDEMGRVRLDGDIDPHQYVTGVVCALRGRATTGGRFSVADVCFRRLAVVSGGPSGQDDAPHMLLLSGLEMSSHGADPAMTQLLCDVISGQLGDSRLQHQMALVAHVLIAGNSVAAGSKDGDIMTRAAYLSRADHISRSAEAVRLLDHVLQQLCSSCHVLLMPGEFDPSNHMLPQQPLHSCLLPRSRRYTGLQTVTNPFQARVADRLIVGSSGQNVDDIRRFSRVGQQEDNNGAAAAMALRKLLDWRHLCPTAPDTLACTPMADSDPYMLSACPHMIFAGNQPEYHSELYPVDDSGASGTMVRLVCIPSFRRTGSAVLLNLVTMETQLVTIADHLVDDDVTE